MTGLNPHRLESISEERILAKIRQLSPQKAKEAEKFLDFLLQYQENSSDAFTIVQLTEPVLVKIWDNPEDADYDNL